jgi:hypothetical protein
MGTCHVTMHPRFVERVCDEYKHQVRVVSSEEFGDGLLLVILESNLLPAGYQGEMELSILNGQLRFKKWADT